MNPNPHALKAALLLLGETEESIATEYLFKRQPALPDHRNAFAPLPGEPGHVPAYFPEWATEQKHQDLIALQQFAWERLFAEILKAQRLEQQHPELLKDADFLAYRQTVKHAIEIVSGRVAFVPGRGAVRSFAPPDLAGHRIGSWPEEDAQ
ncbi:hypothetical protein P6M10_001274 [Pseudomonas aeruginosa]|nr:hypothetical protein [Pseudomonas aeruginosa]MBX5729586.1 hypothetical protein [Pseudomonas aeruginosa]MBX5777809.1 hypothetical protein [Pseudomonas aeruginosa]MDI4062555.1 hypothetical protein [Pseudomonas aeruginosa]HEJ6235069.1 hypothetical protein [Pseudomonas aeruginosa]